MGRKGKWFGAVKRVFNHETKGEIGQKRSRSMKEMTIGCCYIEPDLHEDLAPHSAVFPLPQEEVSLAYPENDHNKEAVNEAYSQNDHNEGDVKMACVENDHTEEDNKLVFLRNIDDNKSEVVRYKKFPGEFKEDAAATAIQAEFRGYVVRKAMRAVRGTMRLKSMIHSDTVKNQSASALLCMQMLVRAQAQIRSRRIKMAEENKAIESQQELKFERELEKLKLQQGDKWDDSIRTTEQHNSHLKFKQEAAIRRERSLSYAHRLCGSDTKDLENCKNEFYEGFTMDDVGLTFGNYEELFGGTHDQSGQLFDDAGIDSFFDMYIYKISWLHECTFLHDLGCQHVVRMNINFVQSWPSFCSIIVCGLSLARFLYLEVTTVP